MSKTTTMSVEIRFGDCDPAGIVFFPALPPLDGRCVSAFLHDLRRRAWHVLEGPRPGIIGTPLLEHHARFVKSATYGERLTISTCIDEWRRKVFVQKHTVTRGDELICESRETRVFCVRDAQDRRRIHAIPVPEDIRGLCE